MGGNPNKLVSDYQAVDAELLQSLLNFDDALRGDLSIATKDLLESDSMTCDERKRAQQFPDWSSAAACLVELESLFPRRKTTQKNFIEVPKKIGRFEIDGVLGTGGFGVVYKAFDQKLNRAVAIKVPRLHAFAAVNSRRRFLREAHATAKLDHPNIVPIYEAGEADELPYIAYAYCQGPTLAKWYFEQTEGLDPKRAAQLLLPIVNAIQYSHSKGILHRDIKPANILLFPQTPTSEADFPFVPRVSDLGLAKLVESTPEETISITLLGTPPYMSPEQTVNGEVGPTTDVYSLGATLYFLLTGRPPFLSNRLIELLQQIVSHDPIPPVMLNTAIDLDLNTICMKCLDKLPANRYASSQELADDLQRYLNGEPITARPSPAYRHAVRWCRRNPAIATLAAGVLTLALGLLSALISNSYTTNRFNQQLAARNAELESAIDRLDQSLSTEEQQRVKAELNEKRSKELLYAADVQSAALAFKQNDLRSTAMYLKRHDFRPNDLDFCWHYLSSRVPTTGELLYDLDNQIWGLALAPDGQTLAACDDLGWVYILDLAGEVPVRKWDTGHREVNSVAFANDGDVLATAGDDGRIGIWNVKTATIVRWLEFSKDDPAFGVEFYDGGSKIVACGTSPDVTCWNANTGEVLQTIATRHARGVEALSVSPDGKQFATVGEDGFARIFKFGTAEPAFEIEIPNHRLATVRFASDGQSLVTGDKEGLLQIWDAKTGVLLAKFQASDAINAIAVYSNGLIATSDRGGSIHLFDSNVSKLAANRTELESELSWQPLEVWIGQDHRLNGLAFDKAGSAVFSGSSKGEIAKWSKASKPLDPTICAWNDYKGITQFDGFYVDERNLNCYVAGAWGLECWDLQTSSRIAFVLRDRELWGCKAIPNSHDLIACDSQGNFAFVDIDATLPAARVKPWTNAFAGSPIEHMEVSADGKMLAMIAGTSEVVLIDLSSKKEIARLQNRSAVAFSPDGRLLAVGKHGANNVEILNLLDLSVQQELEPHASSIHNIEFSPDGKLLVTTSGDRTARVWDVNTWTLSHELVGHAGAIYSVAFSSDGKTIATGDSVGRIMLWHALNGQHMLDLVMSEESVSSLHFTRSGRELVAQNAAHCIQLFRTSVSND